MLQHIDPLWPSPERPACRKEAMVGRACEGTCWAVARGLRCEGQDPAATNSTPDITPPGPLTIDGAEPPSEMNASHVE